MVPEHGAKLKKVTCKMLIMAGRVKLAQNKFYHAQEHEHQVESHSSKPKRSWFKFWTRPRYDVPVSSHHEDRAQKLTTTGLSFRAQRPTTSHYSSTSDITGIQLYAYAFLFVASSVVLFPVH